MAREHEQRLGEMEARHRSIARSLLFRVGILVLLVESLFLFAFTAYYVRAYWKEVDGDLVASITRPGTMIASGLLSMSAVATPGTMASLVSGEVIEAMIIGADGNVFQSSRPSDVGRTAPSVTNFDLGWLKQSNAQSLVIRDADAVPQTIASVTPVLSIFAASPAIFVYVKASSAQAESDKQRIAWAAFGGAGLAVSLSVCLVSVVVHTLISRKLRHLMRFFRRIGAGDFDARIVGAPGSSEVEALQSGFNEMAFDLASRTRALKTSEERYALAAAGANDGLWDLDLITGRLYVSDRWKSMMALHQGVSISSLPDWLTILPPSAASLIEKELEAHLNKDQATFECEYQVTLAAHGGETRWMHLRGLAFRDQSGQAVRVAGSQTDVTERREAQERLARQRDDLEVEVQQRTRELREAERRLVTAIDTAPDGLTVVEPSGRIVVVNDRVAEVLPELAHVLIVGADLPDVLSQAAASFGLPATWVDRHLGLFREEASYTAELHLPSGRWLQLSASRTPDGSVVARLADITVYKDASDALQVSVDKEREIARLHRDFVSMASHQFRTPLAIIDAAAQRIARIKASDLQKGIPEHASIVRTAASKMTALINSLLNSARLDSGDVEYAPRPVLIGPLIQEICRRHQEIAPSVEIRSDLSELPSVLFCDPLLIEQIFANLLSNAVKFAGSRPLVEVIGSRQDSDAIISVRDFGVGIPKEDQERIFQRFNRARTASGIAGTGIGLNLAHRLAALHGGRLEVESQVGEGSCFSLCLPLTPTSEQK
ncbi:MAG: PAS-domain containing protein [Rhodospirillaceae bacterium]|nr:PAS-domain containing protein [Rhodospirillaceae bacterium]